MSTYKDRLSALSRPRLLVRAARLCSTDINRERSLRRVMQGEAIPSPGQAFEQLLERESAMNDARCHGGAAYSPARHVELLSALMHEAEIAEKRILA